MKDICNRIRKKEHKKVPNKNITERLNNARKHQCYTRMTASSNTMRTITSMIIHQLLLESSESRRNLRMRRIAPLILVSDRSTFRSRSSSILSKEKLVGV